MKKLLQQGYSLIELMIALLLGAILILGVTQLMISTSTLGTTTNNLLTNQDIAKSVFDLIGDDMRKVGYNGCSKLKSGRFSLKPPAEIKMPYEAYPIYPLITENGALVFGFRLTYAVDAKSFTLTDNAIVYKSVLNTKDCLGRELYMRTMVYYSLIKNDPITGKRRGVFIYGDGTQKIENVMLYRMDFTIPIDETTGKYKTLTLTPDSELFRYGKLGDVEIKALNELSKAKSITIYIDVQGVEADGVRDKSSNQVNRKYSATYQLRNL